jgi:hypothetical protein
VETGGQSGRDGGASRVAFVGRIIKALRKPMGSTPGFVQIPKRAGGWPAQPRVPYSIASVAIEWGRDAIGTIQTCLGFVCMPRYFSPSILLLSTITVRRIRLILVW